MTWDPMEERVQALEARNRERHDCPECGRVYNSARAAEECCRD